MTTIAYKDGIIAYDSRVLQDRTIVSDKYDKHRQEKDVHFFFSGDCASIDNLVDFFMNGEKPKEKIRGATAIVWDGKTLWYLTSGGDEGMAKCRESLDNPCAIGSGTDYALTAMDMGATAEEAIGWAAKRDAGTGGTIRTYKVF